MHVTEDQVEVAYRKLKSLVYYDKTDLRLRARLAAFECDETFAAKLAAVHRVVNVEHPAGDRQFRRWLKGVGFRLVPKKLKPGPQDRSDDQPEHGRFITNVTTAPAIEVERVNYFFDGPIELHLIAVLWIMREGRVLDAMLGAECCGSRLSSNLHEEDDESIALFAKYHEQYARWRDTGIRRAKQLLVASGPLPALGVQAPGVRSCCMATFKPWTGLIPRRPATPRGPASRCTPREPPCTTAAE